jgi:hypothetical protein
MAAPLREHFARLSVVIEIHQESELDAVAGFDEVLLPPTPFDAGILVPPDAIAMRGGTDHVRVAVAVYVEHQIRQVLGDIAVVFDGAKLVLGPVRSFIPVLARDDIGMSVAVDVADRTGFVSTGVDQMLRERNLGGTRIGPHHESCKTCRRYRPFTGNRLVHCMY